MTRIGTQVLVQTMNSIPDIESFESDAKLTETHKKILRFLQTKRHPKLAKTIAIHLNLSRDSVRARLSELSKMNYVFQPLKGIDMADLDDAGQIGEFANIKKCGYLLS